MTALTDNKCTAMHIYLVGGAVRDAMLQRPVTERDWVVTGATAEDLLDQGFTQVGKDFPVFLHPTSKEEYALARVEKKAGTGYTGFDCDAGPHISLEQDLLRRDLTINAMAQDADGTLIDPYQGQADLQQRVLRHVSPAFSEDPLRVFRVARFAARYHYLGFTVAPDTLALMQDMAAQGMLSELTAERVWQETHRALSDQDSPVYFTTLAQANALDDWFAELTEELPRLARVLPPAHDAGASVAERMALVCAGLSPKQASALCQRLRCANEVSQLAELAARFAQVLSSSPEPAELLAIFDQADAWRKPQRFDALLRVAALNQPGEVTEAVKQALNAAAGVDVQQIIRAGHKGPAIREALKAERLTQIHQVIAQQAAK